MKQPTKTRTTEVLKRLETALKESGAKSGREFSERVGLKPTSAAKTFSGATALTPTLANSIELIYGIRAKWLLEGKGPMRVDHRLNLPERERRLLEFMQGTLSLATVRSWIFSMVRILADHMRSAADYDEFIYNDTTNIADEGKRRQRSGQWQKLHRELEEKLRGGAIEVVTDKDSLYSGLDYLMEVYEQHRDGRKLPSDLSKIIKKFETLEREGQ